MDAAADSDRSRDPRGAARAFAVRMRDRVLGPGAAPAVAELSARVEALSHQLDGIHRAQVVASSEREVLVEQLALVSARVETILEELRGSGSGPGAE